MFQNIRTCENCKLFHNQKPLLDIGKKSEVFWVGLSAKKVLSNEEIPLSPKTNTGKLISDIENKCSGFSAYRTNVVKCAPLDDTHKLRYPTTKEINSCIGHLESELNELLPRIVFLLGKKVTTSVSKVYRLNFAPWDDFAYKYLQFKGIFFIPVHHPSYIHVYQRKRKDAYINSLSKLISGILNK